jgi:hypothetical protein
MKTNSYERVEDIEFDEELELLLNKFWLKLVMALFMDTLGLALMFLICDLGLRGPLSYIYYWNPFDYFISWSYPQRVLPGAALMFSGVCASHLMGSIISTIKYRDRPDKYLARVMRTYIQRIQQSSFKKRT